MNNGLCYDPFWSTSCHDKSKNDAGAAPSPYWLKIVSPWYKTKIFSTGQHPYGKPQEFSNICSYEIGHSFGLFHSWGGGTCPDTPAHPNCWDNTGCGGQPASNNLMDYNNCQCALTPCQLATVHQ